MIPTTNHRTYRQFSFKRKASINFISSQRQQLMKPSNSDKTTQEDNTVVQGNCFGRGMVYRIGRESGRFLSYSSSLTLHDVVVEYNSRSPRRARDLSNKVYYYVSIQEN